jgi:hypothetical protein
MMGEEIVGARQKQRLQLKVHGRECAPVGWAKPVQSIASSEVAGCNSILVEALMGWDEACKWTDIHDVLPEYKHHRVGKHNEGVVRQGIVRESWSAEEDAQIISWVQERVRVNGQSWQQPCQGEWRSRFGSAGSRIWDRM